ncbi:methyltransferase domain-containing protein [Candidatus Halocynthiibacter alkanivorans]|uniref:methyltransferase domain-containing protein n=1 Tax=Candidatus Halocynthiibacter alkanivorans TaxID=2267619 RepID=UPI000DF38077|nr:class I SAM-dependent methyltransferase [Candidatus Halocynthiibacter alkanivorans]
MADRTDLDVAERWNQNADQWTRDVRGGIDVYRDLFTFPAFQDFLPSLDQLDVIDFGCGEGSNTRRFAQIGARMTGIDLSERLIEHARDAEIVDPVGIDYRVTSYSEPSGFSDASFDAVVSTMALMDGPDINGAMREAYRLLRPGGFVVFSVLHPCFITPGSRWDKDAGGRKTGLYVSRYFDVSSFTERWIFSDQPDDMDVQLFAVPRFPRTISDYLNAVADAGLRVTQVEEPRPTPEACKTVPRFSRWRDHAAFLLLIKAEKHE